MDALLRKKLDSSVKKNVTISDIAAHANVSKSTVSRVLNDTTPVNEEKRQAVLAAMKEMNFEPNIFARGLASGQSYTCLLYTSPSPRDQRGSRMPSSA